MLIHLNFLPANNETSLTSGTSMKSLVLSDFLDSEPWYNDTSIFGIGRELLRLLGCC